MEATLYGVRKGRSFAVVVQAATSDRFRHVRLRFRRTEASLMAEISRAVISGGLSEAHINDYLTFLEALDAFER